MNTFFPRTVFVAWPFPLDGNGTRLPTSFAPPILLAPSDSCARWHVQCPCPFWQCVAWKTKSRCMLTIRNPGFLKIRSLCSSKSYDEDILIRLSMAIVNEFSWILVRLYKSEIQITIDFYNGVSVYGILLNYLAIVDTHPQRNSILSHYDCRTEDREKVDVSFYLESIYRPSCFYVVIFIEQTIRKWCRSIISQI